MPMIGHGRTRNNMLFTTDIIKWEDAQSILPALTFDLGQSPEEIKSYFDEGGYLKWNSALNHYLWVKGFTCSNCTGSVQCPYAFDPYNTDGDCLADK